MSQAAREVGTYVPHVKLSLQVVADEAGYFIFIRRGVADKRYQTTAKRARKLSPDISGQVQ